MALTDYLRDELIFLDLHPTDVRDCLEMMIAMAAKRGAIADAADALSRLMERERTMSTGMGGGVAVPHAKSDRCRAMTVVFGRIPDGVDFRAIDGRPVHIVFLLFGPPDSTRQHVDLLARIAYLVKTPGVIESLKSAPDAGAVSAILRSAATASERRA